MDAPNRTEGVIEVVRVRTRETLARPEVAQFVLRGARACGFPVPSAILAELLLDPGSENTGIFVGTVDGEPRYVAIGFIPSSAFFLAATVALAYSEQAPRAVAVLVTAKLREWLRGQGHDRVQVANLLHTDRSYIRGLRYFGRGSRIGSVIEFELD